MKALQAKVKLLTQTFLFGEKIHMRRGQEVVYDLSKLTIGDLEILAYHIRRGEVESNIPSEKFIERAGALRKEVQQGKYDNLLKIEDTEEVRILDAEIELEDGTKTTIAALEEAQKEDPRVNFIQDKILNASTALAMVAAKNIPDVDLEIIEFAKTSEINGKNRRGVISSLDSEIKRLKESVGSETATTEEE
jgi:succinate dehydrogenase flavin-adding protein (antitoxin of CptAB toxin-antitoxin module)